MSLSFVILHLSHRVSITDITPFSLPCSLLLESQSPPFHLPCLPVSHLPSPWSPDLLTYLSHSLFTESGAGKISSPSVGHKKGGEGITVGNSSSINGISSTSSAGMLSLFPFLVTLSTHSPFCFFPGICCFFVLYLSLTHVYTYAYVTLSLIRSTYVIDII